ncbi:MAG TPA: alpha/beta hydrolase [Leeuwenhoekiella sp.]|nr:alpha/beta hydrolase [Leeuwenhoekiella sp.]
MRSISLFIIYMLTSFLAYSQEMYVGQVYANIEKSVHTYADTLRLDFYTAKESRSTADRPLLVVVHGGGFAGGKRDNPEETKFAQKMATKGYAVASISYDLTRAGKRNGFGCDCPAALKIETFKTNSKNILDAVDYLKNGEDFNFDANKIILVGSSAGAEGVLNTVYMQAYPDYAELHLDRYKFAAVVSFAGAVLDARYIQEENAVPAFLIHGKKDQLVPYSSAPHHFCKLGDFGFLPLDGSKIIADHLKELNASHYLVTAPEGNHDWSGLGYGYVDAIAKFVNSVVNKGENVQVDDAIAEEKN